MNGEIVEEVRKDRIREPGDCVGYLELLNSASSGKIRGIQNSFTAVYIDITKGIHHHNHRKILNGQSADCLCA